MSDEVPVVEPDTTPPAAPATVDYTRGQFPSLDGDVHGEVDQRQPEDNGPGWFHKVFSVHNRAHTVGLPADHEYHRGNFVAVLQDAIQRGLHPKGEPQFVAERPHPTDPNTTDIEYWVAVTPAIVDHEPQLTATPSVELVPDAPPTVDDPVPPVVEPAAPPIPVEPPVL